VRRDAVQRPHGVGRTTGQTASSASTRLPRIARGTSEGAPAPGAPHTREPEVQPSLTCSWLHLPKLKSLLKAGGFSSLLQRASQLLGYPNRSDQ
jgi:hypothetical protein